MYTIILINLHQVSEWPKFVFIGKPLFKMFMPLYVTSPFLLHHPGLQVNIILINPACLAMLTSHAYKGCVNLPVLVPIVATSDGHMLY